MTTEPIAIREGVLITLSGEVYLKSHRTQRRFIGPIRRNLASALEVHPEDLPWWGGNRLFLATVPTADRLGAAASVFGVGAVEVGVELGVTSLDEIQRHVLAMWGERAGEGAYAVRVRRRGRHGWRSSDAERQIGAALQTPTNRVDLEQPDHLIRIRVDQTRTWITSQRREGPHGLPVGTQEPVLCLVSGGFDSAVAAWMMMSRGCPVHFVHFGLECAQADHAIAVAQTLVEKWGHGVDPMVHLVDFRPVASAIQADVRPRMRQVVLKTLMARAAGEIADGEEIGALVTGDALGQVSTQTLTHLRSIDQGTPLPLFRPLLGMDKQEIISLARRVGTADLSARAKEVCNLTVGEPVAVEAQPPSVRRSTERVDPDLVRVAVDSRQAFPLRDWAPGLYSIGSAA